jgi:hypothetical protein
MSLMEMRHRPLTIAFLSLRAILPNRSQVIFQTNLAAAVRMKTRRILQIGSPMPSTSGRRSNLHQVTRGGYVAPFYFFWHIS